MSEPHTPLVELIVPLLDPELELLADPELLLELELPLELLQCHASVIGAAEALLARDAKPNMPSSVLRTL